MAAWPDRVSLLAVLRTYGQDESSRRRYAVLGAQPRGAVEAALEAEQQFNHVELPIRPVEPLIFFFFFISAGRPALRFTRRPARTLHRAALGQSLLQPTLYLFVAGARPAVAGRAAGDRAWYWSRRCESFESPTRSSGVAPPIAGRRRSVSWVGWCGWAAARSAATVAAVAAAAPTTNARLQSC